MRCDFHKLNCILQCALQMIKNVQSFCRKQKRKAEYTWSKQLLFMSKRAYLDICDLFRYQCQKYWILSIKIFLITKTNKIFLERLKILKKLYCIIFIRIYSLSTITNTFLLSKATGIHLFLILAVQIHQPTSLSDVSAVAE